jgi:protocatechuate 3,4-dioxygenase beta subunit
MMSNAACRNGKDFMSQQIRAIDENTITEAAIEQMAGTPDARLREIMACLVKHLHSFAREVDLQPSEWMDGIKFLTNVGQTCTPYRQEFILLSDTLGLSTLINALHDKRAKEHGTKTSLLGPFYRQDSPQRKLGEAIFDKLQGGQEICIYGRVTDKSGKGLANASVEIWQTDENGAYDLQRQDPSLMDLRGHFHTDANGNYHLRTVLPIGYMIPMDGPVGDMIRAQRRHGFRPAHIHFLIGAPGHRELVTALYMNEDDHIGSDTVFGVTASLVTTPKTDSASPRPDLPSIHYDFALGVEVGDGTGRVGADPSQILKASH